IPTSITGIAVLVAGSIAAGKIVLTAAQDFPKARDCLEELKRVGKNGQPRRRERLTRERIERHYEGDCSVM
ncbi:hypothetical protein E4U40_007164, partial [Claviceps sp. LM458 group G5]